MDQRLFREFTRIIYDHSGISLPPGKEILLSARIQKRLRALRIPSLEEYLRFLHQDSEGQETVNLLDVVSTNVTRFFREEHAFRFLEDEARKWAKAGKTRIRLWSCACSTGEEPYSMAISMAETLGLYGIDWKILATDISTRVLEKARAGAFSKDLLETVPPDLRLKYFQLSSTVGGKGSGTPKTSRPGAQGATEKPGEVTVKPELREKVVFHRLNLAHPPFPMHGPLDGVFCRNVMIYFDDVVRKALLMEIHRLLAPCGHLYVGSAESMVSLISPFKNVASSILRKVTLEK